MSEEEYLLQFLEFGNQFANLSNKDLVNDFMRMMHKDYRTVYFYKKRFKEDEIVKAQMKIKLLDFIDYLDQGFDKSYIESKIDGYIERNFK